MATSHATLLGWRTMDGLILLTLRYRHHSFSVFRMGSICHISTPVQDVTNTSHEKIPYAARVKGCAPPAHAAHAAALSAAIRANL